MAAGGGGPPATDMGAVWVVVAVFVIVYMVWYFAHTQIVAGYFYIKHFEVAFIQFFIKGFAPSSLADVSQVLQTTSPSAVSFQELAYVANEVGYYLRFPIAAILLIWAFLLYNRSTTEYYKTKYNMETLLRNEVQNWPQSTPVIGLDLVKQDIDRGSWSMAISPMTFAKKYKLVREEGMAGGEDRTAIKSHIKVGLRKDKASRLFALQVGRLWTGVESLNAYDKAIYAALITKAARDGEACLRFLNQISASAKSGHLDFSGTDELIKKYNDYPPVVEIRDKHAYVTTVLASLLQLARTDGVLPTSEFLWLKPVDRRLWFMLNAVGRQTPSVEIAGAFAHWLAEKEIGRHLRTPMVDQAVKALESALHEVIYNPNE